MPGTYSKHLFHVIFATKERLPLIPDEVRPRLHAYMGGIVRSKEGVAYAIGGTKDHVHILLGLDPDARVSYMVRDFKSRATAWMRREMGHPEFEWQEGYASYTVSESVAERVRKYIENQEEHHRHRTFLEEFKAFLVKHRVPFEEKYLE